MGKLMSGLKGSASRFKTTLGNNFTSAWNNHGVALGDYLNDYRDKNSEKNKARLKEVTFGDSGLGGVIKDAAKKVDWDRLKKTSPLGSLHLESPAKLQSLMSGEGASDTGNIKSILESTGINLSASGGGLNVSKILSMAKKGEIDPKDLGMNVDSMVPKIDESQFDASKYESMSIGDVDPESLLKGMNTDMQIPNFTSPDLSADQNKLQMPSVPIDTKLNLSLNDSSFTPDNFDVFNPDVTSFGNLDVSGLGDIDSAMSSLPIDTSKYDIASEISSKFDLSKGFEGQNVSDITSGLDISGKLNEFGFQKDALPKVSDIDGMKEGMGVFNEKGLSGMLDIKGAISEVSFGNDLLDGLLKAIFSAKDKVIKEKGITGMNSISSYIDENGNLKLASGMKEANTSDFGDAFGELEDVYGMEYLLHEATGDNYLDIKHTKESLDYSNSLPDDISMPKFNGDIDAWNALNNCSTQAEYDELIKKLRK